MYSIAIVQFVGMKFARELNLPTFLHVVPKRVPCENGDL